MLIRRFSSNDSPDGRAVELISLLLPFCRSPSSEASRRDPHAGVVPFKSPHHLMMYCAVSLLQIEIAVLHHELDYFTSCSYFGVGSGGFLASAS